MLRNKIKNYLVSILFLLVSILFLSSNLALSKELVSLRIANVPFIVGLPVEMIQQNGWDKESGYEIEQLIFTGGPSMMEALAANEWDVALTGAASIAGAARYNLKILSYTMDTGWGQDIFVRPDTEIAKIKGWNSDYPEVYGSPDTVKGSTILVPIATLGHYIVLNWLEVLGLTSKDVELLHMSVPQIVAAFKAGRADVAFIWAPLTAEAKKENWVRAAGKQPLRLNLTDVIDCNNNFYKDNPEVLAKFIRDYFRAVEVLREDPEGYFNKLKAWYIKNGLDLQDWFIREEIENRPYVTIEESLEITTSGQLSKWFETLGDFFISQGQYKSEDIEKTLKAIVSDVLEKAVDLK